MPAWAFAVAALGACVACCGCSPLQLQCPATELGCAPLQLQKNARDGSGPQVKALAAALAQLASSVRWGLRHSSGCSPTVSAALLLRPSRRTGTLSACTPALPRHGTAHAAALPQPGGSGDHCIRTASSCTGTCLDATSIQGRCSCPQVPDPLGAANLAISPGSGKAISLPAMLTHLTSWIWCARLTLAQ